MNVRVVKRDKECEGKLFDELLVGEWFYRDRSQGDSLCVKISDSDFLFYREDGTSSVGRIAYSEGEVKVADVEIIHSEIDVDTVSFLEIING